MAVLMGYMALSPAWLQVFRGKGYLLRPWVMYSGVAFDVCRAQFYDRAADGTLAPIDAGDGGRRWSPLLTSASAARGAARGLCGDRKTDVRAQVECASRSRGWKREIKTDEVLCKAGPRAPR